MKRTLLPRDDRATLPEYGKRRLILYADTLKEIAHGFDKKASQGEEAEGVQLYLLKLRQEQTSLFADQLNETANALKDLANETYATDGLLLRMRKRIERELSENGLLVENLYVVEVEEHLEIGMRVCANSDEIYYTDELADFLSGLCHKKLRQHEDNPTYIQEENRDLIFEEEVNYYILDGIARAKKENEEDSGDSYLLREFARGIYLVALSDGMGSGVEAADDSERLLETLEHFLESGFHVDQAGALLNSQIFLQGKEDHTVTLDACEIDLYQGTCRFLKYGAATSFLKRGRQIYKIGKDSLPLGVFAKGEPDESAYGLEDGDYIIMMTDGVSEAFSDTNPISIMRDFLKEVTFDNPRQVALSIINAAISSSGGRIRDDMTVIVFGIFANT